MKFTTIAIGLWRREWHSVVAQGQEWLLPWFFFILVVSLFPLTLPPQSELLRIIGPGVIWVAVLLAHLLALEHLFRSDFMDGSLAQMAVSPHPLSGLILIKILSHWCFVSLPLVLIAPLLAMMLQISNNALWILFLSLLIGTPTLSFVGAIASALTVGLRCGGLLLSLLTLPWMVPILIFGTRAVQDANNGFSPTPSLALLAAVMILSLTLCPWATAAAIRVRLS